MTIGTLLVARDEVEAAEATSRSRDRVDQWIELRSFGFKDAEALAASSDRPELLLLRDTQLLRDGHVRSPEAFLKIEAVLAGAGISLASLDDPVLDTRRPEFLATLRWATELRSKGIASGTKQWHDANREAGRRNRWPKCATCDHRVVRASNVGAGHNMDRRTGQPGRCSVEDCGCDAMGGTGIVRYRPVNEELMGRSR